MGMNPDTNKFEHLREVSAVETMRKAENQKALADLQDKFTELVRPDGSPVPRHWSVFKVGEHAIIKDYTFEVKYIGESAILFEPVGPVILEGAEHGSE